MNQLLLAEKKTRSAVSTPVAGRRPRSTNQTGNAINRSHTFCHHNNENAISKGISFES